MTLTLSNHFVKESSQEKLPKRPSNRQTSSPQNLLTLLKLKPLMANYNRKREKMNKIEYSQILILPQDLIFEEILPRLPAKSLIRFKSVCKYWFSSIYSPNFAKAHLQFSSSNPIFLVLLENRFNWKDEILLLHYDDLYCAVNKIAQLVFDDGCNRLIKFFKLIGSCNGLVCLRVLENPQFFYIWNPATRRRRRIEFPDDQNIGTPYVCHFMYASSIDDYKIFASFSSRVDDGFVDVDVFSFKNGNWKRIYALNKCYQGRYLEDVVLINDSVYFFRGFDSWRVAKHVVGFDLVTEQTKELPWMNWLIEYSSVRLLQIKGCLSLLCSTYGHVVSDVWMLRKPNDFNSWEKVFSIDLNGIAYSYFSETGKCLLHHHGQLKIASPSEETPQLSQCTVGYGYSIIQSLNYVESLVSPF